MASCAACAATVPPQSDTCPRCGSRLAAPQAGTDGTGLPTLLAGAVPAGPGGRAGAAVIDVVVGAVVAIPLVLGAVAGSPAMIVVGGLLLAAYVIGSWVAGSVTGRTVGKVATGLRTVDHLTGLPIGLRGHPADRWTRVAVLDVRTGRDPVATVAESVLQPLAQVVEGGFGPATAEMPRVPAPAAPAATPSHPATTPPAPLHPALSGPASAGVDQAPVSSVPGAAPATPPAPAGPPPTPPTPTTPARDSVIIAVDDGQRFEIRGTALLGRNPQPLPGEPVDLLVPINDLSRSVSKTHATLRWDGHLLWVTDRGSTNGTAVRSMQGHRPADQGEVPAAPGETVEVGDRTFFVEPAAATGGAR